MSSAAPWLFRWSAPSKPPIQNERIGQPGAVGGAAAVGIEAARQVIGKGSNGRSEPSAMSWVPRHLAGGAHRSTGQANDMPEGLLATCVAPRWPAVEYQPGRAGSRC